MLYNFILVDDNKDFLDLIESIIKKEIKRKNLKCNIYKFSDYNNEFFKVMHRYMINKIFILDIETPSANGITIASKIREFDNESQIMFISAYEDEYLRAIIKSDTNYFCSISKKTLKYSLEIKLNKLFNLAYKKIIKLKVKDYIYSINENDIFYIEFNDRKTFVHTSNDKIETNYTLSEIYKMLSKEFVYSHKACIINMKRVIDYSLTDKKIIFDNKNTIVLISRTYIENLDNFFKSNNKIITN